MKKIGVGLIVVVVLLIVGGLAFAGIFDGLTGFAVRSTILSEKRCIRLENSIYKNIDKETAMLEANKTGKKFVKLQNSIEKSSKTYINKCLRLATPKWVKRYTATSRSLVISWGTNKYAESYSIAVEELGVDDSNLTESATKLISVENVEGINVQTHVVEDLNPEKEYSISIKVNGAPIHEIPDVIDEFINESDLIFESQWTKPRKLKTKKLVKPGLFCEQDMDFAECFFTTYELIDHYEMTAKRGSEVIFVRDISPEDLSMKMNVSADYRGKTLTFELVGVSGESRSKPIVRKVKVPEKWYDLEMTNFSVSDGVATAAFVNVGRDALENKKVSVVVRAIPGGKAIGKSTEILGLQDGELVSFEIKVGELPYGSIGYKAVVYAKTKKRKDSRKIKERYLTNNVKYDLLDEAEVEYNYDLTVSASEYKLIDGEKLTCRLPGYSVTPEARVIVEGSSGSGYSSLGGSSGAMASSALASGGATLALSLGGGLLSSGGSSVDISVETWLDYDPIRKVFRAGCKEYSESSAKEICILHAAAKGIGKSSRGSSRLKFYEWSRMSGAKSDSCRVYKKLNVAENAVRKGGEVLTADASRFPILLHELDGSLLPQQTENGTIFRNAGYRFKETRGEIRPRVNIVKEKDRLYAVLA